MRIVLVLRHALPSLAFAHGGGLDSNGRHFNGKTGQYHCHREPCFSNQRSKPEPKPKAPKKPAEERPGDEAPAQAES